MTNAFATDEMVEWYTSLTEEEAKIVDRYVHLLCKDGVALGYPHSSAIRASKYALRELRISVGRAELRIIYAFDPRRDAILIIGGNKTGDNRFYEWIIPLAERTWEQYLQELSNWYVQHKRLGGTKMAGRHSWAEVVKTKLSEAQIEENKIWVEREILTMNIRAVGEILGKTEEEVNAAAMPKKRRETRIAIVRD